VATIFVRRIIGEARYTPAGVDNVCAMSIETAEELEGLRRAGRVKLDVTAEPILGAGRPGIRSS
jgi:hypothetical protein